jgi:hypothetical protein
MMLTIEPGENAAIPKSVFIHRNYYLYERKFENFVDTPYYSESELCGGAVTVSFTKYLP